MAASNNSPQHPPSNEQVSQQMRSEIESLLDPNMPEPELSPSAVAGDPSTDKCFELFYGVDVDPLENWAKNTNFMAGRLEYSVEEPEVTKDFREFLTIMSGNN